MPTVTYESEVKSFMHNNYILTEFCVQCRKGQELSMNVGTEEGETMQQRDHTVI
jgi:hypothetical protein